MRSARRRRPARTAALVASLGALTSLVPAEATGPSGWSPLRHLPVHVDEGLAFTRTGEYVASVDRSGNYIVIGRVGRTGRIEHPRRVPLTPGHNYDASALFMSSLAVDAHGDMFLAWG